MGGRRNGAECALYKIREHKTRYVQPHQVAEASSELGVGEPAASTAVSSGTNGDGSSGDDSEEAESDEGGSSPPPPAIQLPDRITRGKRLRQAINEEEDEADKDFWDQEFFQEEHADEDYASESEDEDVADTDFDKSESEDEEVDAEQTDKVRDLLKLNKKQVKPPGWKQASQRRAQQMRVQRKRQEAQDSEAGPPSSSKEANRPSSSETPVASVPVLRRSTYSRVQEHEFRRQAFTRKPPTVKKDRAEQQPLMMDEVLRKAAADELANRASLQMMLAREEETKQRALTVHRRDLGPRARLRSAAREGPLGGFVEATDITIIECGGTLPDPYRPQSAQSEPVRPLVVTSSGVRRPRTVRYPSVAGLASDGLLGIVCPRTRYGDPARIPWSVPSHTGRPPGPEEAAVPQGRTRELGAAVHHSGLPGVHVDGVTNSRPQLGGAQSCMQWAAIPRPAALESSVHTSTALMSRSDNGAIESRAGAPSMIVQGWEGQRKRGGGSGAAAAAVAGPQCGSPAPALNPIWPSNGANMADGWPTAAPSNGQLAQGSFMPTRPRSPVPPKATGWQVPETPLWASRPYPMLSAQDSSLHQEQLNAQSWWRANDVGHVLPSHALSGLPWPVDGSLAAGDSQANRPAGR